MSTTLLTLNGVRRRLDADRERTLLSVLREDLDLIGTKYGCGEGQCGACTVLVDGQPARSCRITLAAVAGKSITTIEGLEAGGRLHPLQQAFLDEEALQCGYCTAGMILAAAALLARNPDPSEPEIGRALERNICRCCAYPRIVAAVRAAARDGQRTSRG
jgi:aerobic-type carbon monoxide dehydrogenase small subunit (CoxS/CutS family)